MRNALPRARPLPSETHVGLAYDSWAPVASDGKVAAGEDRTHWLEQLSQIQISEDYERYFKQWSRSFAPCVQQDIVFESRLLVGHGNPSASDVGLTVHHTWGVPLIPASALKGLLSHYVDSTYGPDHPTGALLPAELAAEERERARYRGPWRAGKRILHGPGDVYRMLFGSPDADEDAADAVLGFEVGATRGDVVFHDALYVRAPDQPRPYALDVLTVHQKAYYDRQSGDWPNDYDSPNPVQFLGVRPGTRFRLILTGPEDWTKLALHLLLQALQSWGIGGKTAAGYGRVMPVVDSARVVHLQSPVSTTRSDFGDWLEAERKSVEQRQLLEAVRERWLHRLQALDPAEKKQIHKILEKRFNNKKLQDALRLLLTELSAS